MLQSLSIKNYAIIHDLEISFDKGMNVITGETGAGKSIIMGALGLILGNRADSNVLLNKESKCVIEGIFHAGEKKIIHQFLEANELDGGAELVIRREISAQGKSRAFINDTPVNLAQLQALSSMLVDLHQQFDTLSLGESGFQREVIDALAANAGLVKEYQSFYQQWQMAKQDLDELTLTKTQFEKEADYNRFLLNELEEASFKENELEDLEIELQTASHAEGIKSAVTQASYVLSSSEEPIVQQLKKILQQLQSFSDYHKDLPGLVQRLSSAQIEVQDIADELETLSDRIHFDAEKVEQMNERLSLGYKLQKKHGLHSTGELLNLQEELTRKAEAILNIDDSILSQQRKVNEMFEKATGMAVSISAQRKKQVVPLQDAVNTLLKQVGMPNARLKVDVQQKEMNAWGHDAVEFLFDANVSDARKGDQNFLPLRKVASGGELSRLMLCIKSLVARSIDLPTLIFDEIDTGISGEAARQVGIIMQQLASQRQVICITHQPQIAGKASAHYFVYKTNRDNGITTGIKLLTQTERIDAIARMLSGEKPTAAAIENAREMVMN